MRRRALLPIPAMRRRALLQEKALPRPADVRRAGCLFSLCAGSISLSGRLNKGYLVDLLECCEATPHALKGRLTEKAHAFFLSQLADFRSGLLIQNQLADRVGQIEQFMDRG